MNVNITTGLVVLLMVCIESWGGGTLREGQIWGLLKECCVIAEKLVAVD